jgi:predicted metal-dependent phosphotriesterase family hydrolase
MERRSFFKHTFLSLLGLIGYPLWAADRERVDLMTVNGYIHKKKMGITLPHEHILVDFIGADKIDTTTYNYDKIYETALPILQKLKEAGCQTLIECTPNYLGRSPLLFKRLSDATGLNILTNTGYYGAVDHKYLPLHVQTETSKQLAERWLKEWHEGIEGTGIKPSFMKISVGDAPISDLQRKIVEAAALTHSKSGLTIASHTGGGGAGIEELEIIARQGVHASAFVWIHAQNEQNRDLHFQAARKGAWIEFDGLYPADYKLSTQTINQYLDFLVGMKKEKLLHKTLLSQDAGWYHIGEPNGGNYLPYHLIFSDFIPTLYENGFTKQEVKMLMNENPYQAFRVRKRVK